MGFRYMFVLLVMWFVVRYVLSIVVVLVGCVGEVMISFGMFCSIVMELLLWKCLLKFFW